MFNKVNEITTLNEFGKLTNKSIGRATVYQKHSLLQTISSQYSK